MRTDISSILTSLISAPGISRNPAQEASWLHSSVYHILDDACRQRCSVLEVAASAARRVLSAVANAFHVDMTIGLCNSTFSSLKTPKSRVNSTLIQVRAFRELGSAVSTKAVSTYDLRIAQLSASPIQCKMTIKLTWLIFTESHEHDLKKHPNEHDCSHKINAGPEPASGNLDIQSIHDVHRAVVSFVESKAHSDLDVMVLEASHVAFEAFDRNMQEGRATRIEFKLDEARFDKAGENRPEIKTRYVFDRTWSDRFHKLQKPAVLEPGNHRALVALGSNLGDRIDMIERACTEMDLRDIKVLRTSSLYETEPMYKTDQPSFVNGVCQVRYLNYFPRVNYFSRINPTD